jgi:cyclic pyranopterin phosphate synthase
MSDSSHFDKEGRLHMVDISGKSLSERWAKAEALMKVNREFFKQLRNASLEKGDAIAAARLAGIQAAKRTSDVIPLCHPLAITFIDVDIKLIDPDCLVISSHVKARDATGVEMEALTAVSVAALTIYDMGKAVDKNMVIEKIKLLEKGGGKSGIWRRET